MLGRSGRLPKSQAYPKGALKTGANCVTLSWAGWRPYCGRDSGFAAGTKQDLCENRDVLDSKEWRAVAEELRASAAA
jgi:hypothetical protein